jgi:hypothetical protein
MKDGQGFAKLVTLETLDSFAPLLQRATGGRGAGAGRGGPQRRQATADSELEAAEALFGGNSILVPRPHTIYKLRRDEKRRAGRVETVITLEVAAADNRGPLKWIKPDLPASDVQRQPGNPTGGLRLTQARFTVEARKIDQTSYFRNTLFGEFPWTEKRRTPFVESTRVRFDITILGQPYGIHQLGISHKPSGVAGQSNYTTILHWGVLSGQIRDLNLVGRTFYLYAPAEGKNEPFFIEIA